MSLKATSPSSPVYNYFTLDRAPTSSSNNKRPVPNRSGSSNLSVPSRAALIRTRTGELRAEQRPKLVSHPSGSNTSTPSNGSTICVNTPGASQQQHSREAKNDTAKDKYEVKVGGEDDNDGIDGSIVLVKIIKTGNAGNTDTKALSADEPAGQLVRTGTRAHSADGYRRDEEDDGRDRTFVSGTALGGLTEAMKLESQLLSLKRELHLYQAFDEASGDIFIKSTHDDFFLNLNQSMLEIVSIARPLVLWTENRHHHHYQHAVHLFKHLKTAHHVVSTWNTFYDWLIDVSNKSIRVQREEHGGRVSTLTWERRRKECMDTVERLLRLLGDVEMDEGVRGVLDMQNALRRQWRADGMVGKKEADRLGWVWGVGR